MATYWQVNYSRTDVSHNNEGGIAAQRKASAGLQTTQEETLFSGVVLPI